MTEARVPPGPNLLDDLCSRFVLNVPASELESFEKFMFLVEQAHWFYEDFCREKDPRLKSLSLREFTGLLFGHCPGLVPFRHMLDDIYNNFNKFKRSVPTMGAIILEPKMDKVLLVRGILATHGWGFPKGKVAKDESDHECAIREVIEETGLDISEKLKKDDFIEVHLGLKGDDGIRQQRCRLYIVQGVQESTCFFPKVKGEIGAFAWHLIDELPATCEATKQVFLNADGSRHKFHMVYPFVNQLRAWIRNTRQGVQNGHGRQRPWNGSNATSQNGNKKLSSGPEQANILAPEPQTTHLVTPAQPGQSWIKFAFNPEAILPCLTFR